MLIVGKVNFMLMFVTQGRREGGRRAEDPVLGPQRWSVWWTYRHIPTCCDGSTAVALEQWSEWVCAPPLHLANLHPKPAGTAQLHVAIATPEINTGTTPSLLSSGQYGLLAIICLIRIGYVIN